MSNKSEATWHPNSGPEVPHADLIAELRKLGTSLVLEVDAAKLALQRSTVRHLMREAADALAALGDTVPREDHDQMRADRFSEGWTSAHAHFTPQITTAERERDDARAERDALAHVIEQVRNVLGATYNDCTWWSWIEDGLGGPLHGDLKRILDTAPAVSLALHDTTVWDEGYAAAVEDAVDLDEGVTQNPYQGESK